MALKAQPSFSNRQAMWSLKAACLSTSSGSRASATMTTMGTISPRAAMPYTDFHPHHCASWGAMMAATEVPTLPAPTSPMARPL